MFNFHHFCKYVHVWINEMFVKNLCNETPSKTNFPPGRIKVHLILSYLILFIFFHLPFQAVSNIFLNLLFCVPVFLSFHLWLCKWYHYNYISDYSCWPSWRIYANFFIIIKIFISYLDPTLMAIGSRCSWSSVVATVQRPLGRTGQMGFDPTTRYTARILKHEPLL